MSPTREWWEDGRKDGEKWSPYRLRLFTALSFARIFIREYWMPAQNRRLSLRLACFARLTATTPSCFALAFSFVCVEE